MISAVFLNPALITPPQPPPPPPAPPSPPQPQPQPNTPTQSAESVMMMAAMEISGKGCNLILKGCMMCVCECVCMFTLGTNG